MDHQRENGHVDIANTLMEELMKIHLSGREWQILMVIFRQTWGYCELKDGEPFRDKNGFWVKKKMDRISHTQFEEFTGINRRKVWNILNNLLRKNIIKKTITKNGDITVCNYGIQKDSGKWRLSPKTVTVTKKGDGVSPKTGYGVSPKTVHTKEKNTKETITKETIRDVLRSQIIEYLNKITHSKYKPNTPVTVKHINARLKEGFVLEDFKYVVDVKWAEWGSKFTKEGKSCEDWMRPITLFGPKFEGYLNQEKPDSFDKYLKKE